MGVWPSSDSLKWVPALALIAMAVQDLDEIRSTDLDRSDEAAHALRCPTHGVLHVKKMSNARAHQKRHPCPECGSALGCSEADARDFTLADNVAENVTR